MISWWPGDGNADDIQGGNNGTLQNGATFAVGKVGQSFSFDGVDDYVQAVSTTGIPVGSSARTMDLWFRTPKNLTSSTESALVQYGSTANNQMFGLITSLNAPGKLYFFGYNNDLAGATTLQPNTWYHGAVTYDGATINLYVNGQLEATKTTTALSTVIDLHGLTIGFRPDVMSTWQGEIDEVEIVNRALSQSEIQSIFNADSAGKCKAPNNFSAGFGNYCQSPSGGLGVGFWTNKNGQALITAADLCALNALSLRNTNGTDFDPLTGCPNPTDQQLNAGITALGKWLTAATATNMANMLSAQLAALVLSLRHGYVNGDSFDLCHGTTLNQLILDANASLAANGNTTASGAARTMQEAMKKCLDALNNGGLVVPPGPCQIAYVTALVSRPFDNRAFGSPIEQRAPVLPFAASSKETGQAFPPRFAKWRLRA